jgi:hypothetical protein
VLKATELGKLTRNLKSEPLAVARKLDADARVGLDELDRHLALGADAAEVGRVSVPREAGPSGLML